MVSPLRRFSTLYLLMTVCGILLLSLSLVHARYRQSADQAAISYRAALVSDFKLTDLCLFTEARYTRHPSMADLHSAFQDHPMAVEHFPSGSFVSPPAQIMRTHAKKP